MEPDPIIEEIHAIREAHSKASGDDIRKMAETARSRQAQSGRKAARRPPRTVKGDYTRERASLLSGLTLDEAARRMKKAVGGPPAE